MSDASPILPSALLSFGLIGASFAISAAATWIALHYARRRDLIDLPGRRRSHVVPTPRGGGIGIVVAVLICFCLPWRGWYLSTYGLLTMLPVLMIAGVGWIDDHRSLSAKVRIVVQYIAVLIIPTVITVLIAAEHEASSLPSWTDILLVLTIATAVVWSINLHNFMDGINGLLACQAIFVFVALATLCSLQPEFRTPLLVLAATVLGFLPFNFPRARIFMGDVGSGVLGFLIAVAVLIAVSEGANYGPMRPVALSGIIACSAFVTDATCTLASRMLRGRRWYSAHREHLYQWMVRAGLSHARVVACYMAWNLCIVAPVLWLLNRVPEPGLDHGTGIFLERNELIACAVLYAAAVALWLAGKHWCLQHVKNGGKLKV
ncbi:glycosyltransferase family 4 protein [Rudaea sp.]|uniref:MraY family glycosyltransferase n=1 Tax=Rudaea sp. TaxID=2136325 RepID=UPI002ED4A9D1